ncbi:MAG: 3-deoxy-manno-octulosonate cytidylyltransferase, partial [Magnetococcales bacterium]|nr:3-deoxy-manno-octulosonate cytidylyltransferase [Magnetococcales bacterium]
MVDKVAVVIPARFASTRLPGKPLADIGGRPMIVRVLEQAAQADVDHVVVATDDQRIYDAVKAHNGSVMMTRSDHVSGTDRVAEVARQLDVDIVVNIQGDEPFLQPNVIDEAVSPLRQDASIPMSTLAHSIHTMREVMDPNVVKVVCDLTGFALYFSRAPIPFDRDAFAEWPHGVQTIPSAMRRHVGIYVYRTEFLQTFSKLPPSPLEKYERLEQLRVLENGYRIRVVETESGIQDKDLMNWLNARVKYHP